MLKIRTNVASLARDEAVLLEQIWSGLMPRADMIGRLERLVAKGLCKPVAVPGAQDQRHRAPFSRFVLTVEGREALARHVCRSEGAVRGAGRIETHGDWRPAA